MIKEDRIIQFSFLKNDRVSCLKKVLRYMHYSDPLYYYIYFGYGDGNVDIYKYADKYPEVYDDKGFIRLNESDINDYDLIADFLYEYHDAKLYISECPGLESKHDYREMRDFNFNLGRYTILELGEDYMVLGRDSNMPAWDLEKMGIPIESIEGDDSSEDKGSASLSGVDIW